MFGVIELEINSSFWESSESLRALKVIEVIKENEINISLFQMSYLSHRLSLQNGLCILSFFVFDDLGIIKSDVTNLLYQIKM